jgi:photosystem II stability/assembly factor-like uncharacterized protein
MSHNPVRGGRITAFLACAFLSLAATAAAAPHWTRATPFGGEIAALAEAPSSPRTVYAVAWSGLFASHDGGVTWHRRGELPFGITPGTQLVVDPRDPQTVYAQDGFLYRTRDGGRSWVGLGEELRFVVELALDPDDSRVLYAATESGLYRSLDSGDTWALLAFERTFFLAMAVDPRDAANFLAVIPAADIAPPEVWRSSDHGASWTRALPLAIPDDLYPNAPHFRFDPARPGSVYLFFGGAHSSEVPAFRSTDGGASWTPLPAALGMRDLAVMAEGVLVAASGAGTAQSSDRGATWSPPLPLASSPAASPQDQLERLLVSTAAPGTLLAGGRAGIWRSGDRGGSWAPSNEGLAALLIQSILVEPTDPPRVLAATGSSLYRSTDQGESWTRIHSDLAGPEPWPLEAYDPRRPQTLYGLRIDFDADFVLRSGNGGKAWRRLPMPYDCAEGGLHCTVEVNALTLDPEHPDTVLVAGSYVFPSVASGTFLLRSDDGGATWTELPSSVGNLVTLTFAPGRGGALYGATCSRLFKSGNGGLSWRRVGRGLPDRLCTGNWVNRALAVDPHDTRRVYIGTEGGGVYASKDGGETFHARVRGLEAASRITALLVDPADSTRIYAASPERGVFRWNARSRRWTPLNSGLPLRPFRGILAIDPQPPSTLYAETLEGIFRLDGL